MKAKVGDWVRFYRDGKLVIGHVNYVRTDTVLGDAEYQTDIGSVDEDSLLEVRST